MELKCDPQGIRTYALRKCALAGKGALRSNTEAQNAASWAIVHVMHVVTAGKSGCSGGVYSRLLRYTHTFFHPLLHWPKIYRYGATLYRGPLLHREPKPRHRHLGVPNFEFQMFKVNF